MGKLTADSVIEKMKTGFKLFSSYPYSGGRFTCRIEKDVDTTNVLESVFKELIDRKSIGNPKLRTNREYEYFINSF